MFKNFFRRRKKKKKEVVKEKKKVREAFATASSVGELLSIGKDVRVISVMFPDVKLGVKFLKGEVGVLSDEARKLGISEGMFYIFFLRRASERRFFIFLFFLQVIFFGVSTK